MKTFIICVKDFNNIEMEVQYIAKSKEDAERMVREDYSIDLHCKPEEINILWIEEI